MDRMEKVIKNLKGRISIHIAQKIMRQAKLPSARSWTELEAIIRQSCNANPEVLQLFLNAMSAQSICDLKAVTYFTIAKEDMPMVIRAMSCITVEDTSAAQAFPLSISIDDLQKDNGELKIVHKFQDEYGIGFTLSRKREFTISEEYDREKFTEGMLEHFPEHDKIIAVKNYLRQTFDIVYLNVEKQTIELRADISRSESLIQTVGQLKKSNEDLKAFANVFLYKSTEKQVLSSPHNLYYVIKDIYEDPSGAIKKLGFSTSTNSVKHETMKAGRDLRDELFHKYGAQAINHEMSLFEIAIIWHRMDIDDFDSRPELHIPGTYKNSTSLAPCCDYAILKGMSDPSDSDFVLRKLISFEK